jgi:hypothetical protein
MSDQKFLNQRDAPPTVRRMPVLSLNDANRKRTEQQRGSDPYNTSGSFDRKNNWARVGKR